ncbi:hypothetical protein BLD48_09030 [Exiguobacterium sp. KRL4]|uniref:DUF6612 family protein n=1 Tax=Exiguobacterium sp. KRL4 TaxID=1914536 RepID=UPI0008F80C79|nr:DUF6612 family protein [Exiguobacterium sp. KRL4]OIN66849.1 hypothetical protein BLD48_09030 [Exiguobacterium sp. KRL4]
MKKMRWMTIGIVTATIGLAGCSQTGDNSGASTDSSQLSNTELLKKATAAQEDIKSFHMDSEMMSEVGGMPISQQISADIIQKPMTMYQKMTMKNAEDGTDMETELYLVDDKMYMSQAGQWLVQDTSELGDMLENMESSASTEQSLQLLKKYKENWTMKKDGDVYQIDVDLKGDQLKAFMKDSLEQSGQLAQMKDVMDQVDYKKMEYSMTYDAKTYYPKTLDMEMAFEIEEGTEFTMKNASTFSKFNEIKSIALPAEAKDAQALPTGDQ